MKTFVDLLKKYAKKITHFFSKKGTFLSKLQRAASSQRTLKGHRFDLGLVCKTTNYSVKTEI